MTRRVSPGSPQSNTRHRHIWYHVIFVIYVCIFVLHFFLLSHLLNEKSSSPWWWMWGTLLSEAPSEGWGSNDQKLLPILRLSPSSIYLYPGLWAKSCAHQSQVCKVTVNGVRKWQPRYKQGPVQDFSGNACLFDSRMSQLHIALRWCCILFCRKIYKSQLISASRVFRILWSWKFAQISSAIKLCRWLLSCEFQFILVLLIIFSSLWTQWQWLESGTVELQTVGGDFISSFYY